MTEPDDHELLAQYARRESEAAFAALVGRYVNLVYSAGMRFTGNPHQAEEITQAVFIILARKAGGLGRDVVLSGWLYQTARLTAANFVKGEIRRRRREQEACMQSTLTETDASSWQQIAPLLDEAMGRLGEKDRNAIVLRFFENRSVRDVGAKLKLSEAAAHKRVRRALDKLREYFVSRGMTLTPSVLAGAVSAHSVQPAPAALAKSVTALAITKGATAGGSTATLIKGALKLMAWTKAKTAIVIGAGLLMVVGTATLTLNEIKSSRSYSKVTISVKGYTNGWPTDHPYVVLSLENHERVTIRLWDLWTEQEGNPLHLAPIANPNLPWIADGPKFLEPGKSEVFAVGRPTEPGRWRVCRRFSPEGTTNLFEVPTNLFTTRSVWFEYNR